MKLVTPFSLALIAVLSTSARAQVSSDRTFDVMDTTIYGAQTAMRARTLSCRGLVGAYLARIKAYDQDGPKLNAIQNVNPEALKIATALDGKLKRGDHLGRLFCVPVMVKDQVETSFMPTTYGSLIFKTFTPKRDATIIEKMIAEDAIILAKTNMGEFAARDAGSAFGECRNAYDTGRSASGSSCGSGIAVTANFGLVGIGEDTAGSIRGPASHEDLVALRPTTGLISRFGVLPQGPSRDTVGPITRTVRDNALMLDVLAGFDPKDPVTAASDRRLPASYTDFLRPDGLKGKRIGVLRDSMSKNADPTAPDFKETHAILDQAVNDMRSLGAVLIDPVAVPDIVELVRASGTEPSSYETEAATDNYLAQLPNAPVKTYKEIAESPLVVPTRHKDLMADLGKKPDDPLFLKQLQTREKLKTALLATMAAERLDAFLYLSFDHEPPLLPRAAAGSNRLTAVFAGFPALAIPGGFSKDGLPVGLELMGRPFDEGVLYQIAYGYEQNTNHRRLPSTVPALAP